MYFFVVSECKTFLMICSFEVYWNFLWRQAYIKIHAFLGNFTLDIYTSFFTLVRKTLKSEICITVFRLGKENKARFEVFAHLLLHCMQFWNIKKKKKKRRILAFYLFHFFLLSAFVINSLPRKLLISLWLALPGCHTVVF